MKPPNVCLEAVDLERLADGRIPTECAALLDTHLHQCPVCLERQDRLFGELMELMRDCRSRPPHPEQPLIDRLAMTFKALASTADLSTAIPGHLTGQGNPHATDLPTQSSPVRPEVARLGSYHLLYLLGQGGMGAVYLAEDTILRRQVALKVMQAELAAKPSLRERFLREARAAATVAHDNVVPVFACGECNGVPYLVMPLLKGEPVDKYLSRVSIVPPPLAIRLIRQAAEGLAAAHRGGLIHRDIKPSNLWLETEEDLVATRHPSVFRVKVLDFGLACVVETRGELTRPGEVMGTPAYMAPEQARGAEVDERVDLFGLGCVLYRMVTGRQPFRGPTVSAQLLAVATETPPPACEVNPSVPPGLSGLIDRLLAKDREHRPASAAALIEQLDRLERESRAPAEPPPAEAPPQPAPELVQPPPRSRRGVAVLAGWLGFLALVVAGIIIIIKIKIEIPDKNPPGRAAKEMVGKRDGKKDKDRQRQPGKDRDKPGPFIPGDDPPGKSGGKTETGPKPLYTLDGKKTAVGFSSDSKKIIFTDAVEAGGSYLDSRERVIAVNDKKPVHLAQKKIGPVGRIASSPDGKWYVLAGGRDDSGQGLLLLRSADHKRSIGLGGKEPHKHQVTAVAFSPDGKVLATGGSDWRILLYDVEKQQFLRQVVFLDKTDHQLHQQPRPVFLPHRRRQRRLRRWVSAISARFDLGRHDSRSRHPCRRRGHRRLLNRTNPLRTLTEASVRSCSTAALSLSCPLTSLALRCVRPLVFAMISLGPGHLYARMVEYREWPVDVTSRLEQGGP